MSNEMWVVPLTESLNDRHLYGGKATGLSQLHTGGFLVPEALCVTTLAFQLMLDGLVDDAASLESLNGLFQPKYMPEALKNALERHLDTWCDARPLAVRSSAVDEDSIQASFAGQGLTVLNVVGTQAVLEAVCAVWSSIFSVSQLVYRDRKQLPLMGQGMAVVIQRMIAPRVSGVLFTQNPLSDDPYEIVISATNGLGTQVVDGLAQDTYYLDKRSGYVKRMALVEEGAPILSAEDLTLLSQMAESIYDKFGASRDVEWAIDDVGLCVLQQRPVTQFIDDDTSHDVSNDSFSVWSNANVGEALPGVGTPLTWSIIRRFSEQGFQRAFETLGLSVPDDVELVRSFRGRVYLNLTEFMRIASAIPLLSEDTLFSMAGGGGVETVGKSYTRRAPWTFLSRLPLTIPKVLFNQLSMPIVAPRWSTYFKRQCARFFEKELVRLHPGQLRKVMLEIDTLFDRNGLVMLTCSSNFLMSYVVLQKTLKFLGGEQALEHEHKLVSALSVKSAEPGLDLLELGRVARRALRLRELIESTPAAQTHEILKQYKGQPQIDQFLEMLDAFRARHGHRAPREAELSTPRWREDTTFIFEVLKGFVQSSHLPTVRELAKEQAKSVVEARQVVAQLLPAGVGPLFNALLMLTRANARRRETLRAYVVDSLDMYRRFFLECGRRMFEGDVLKDEQDVFFLTYEEIVAWFDGDEGVATYKLLVLLRRALMHHLSAQPDPPQTFIYKKGQIISEENFLGRSAVQENSEGTKMLFGLPGGAGKISGRACVLQRPEDGASLAPGDILVVPYADVGWTPLFLNAGGVVMALGGPLSHACIVAREYGIPTAVNVKHAMDVVQNGDWLTVDGDRGVVYVSRETMT